jgi:putative SOS response-associated peptidase YedK
MEQFHKPQDEKRMVVILPQQRYQDWLNAPFDLASQFLWPFSAESLQAQHPEQEGRS